MARRPPPRNLPPSSEPWGRDVDQRLMDLETLQSAGNQATQNTLSSLNASLTQLGNQLNTLASTTYVVSNMFTVQSWNGVVSATGDLPALTFPLSGTAFLASGSCGAAGTSSCSITLEVRPTNIALPTFTFATLNCNFMGGGAGAYVQITNLTPQPLEYSDGLIVPKVTSVTAGVPMNISIRVIAANI